MPVTHMNRYAARLLIIFALVGGSALWYTIAHSSSESMLMKVAWMACLGSWALALLTSVGLLLRAVVAIFYRPWRSGAGVSAGLGVLGLGGVGAFTFLTFIGAAWGRPLRVRGRQVHAQLREGTDWARGPSPAVEGLDAATRQALEALWLHDAQKEHASVPAFSRIGWLLAAVGAPAELLAWAHRAALQEVDHARLCFALAAGYGGRTHSVQPMPELLDGIGVNLNVIHVLARESILDGCQLEDFNADVAHECALQCQEPATGQVLKQIAHEERSHAEFSWSLLAWLLAEHTAEVRSVMQRALIEMHNMARPTAVVQSSLEFVQAADEDQLLRHGRIADGRWAELWALRMTKTQVRLERMLDSVKNPDEALLEKISS